MTRTALAIERFFSFINCPNHTESRKPQKTYMDRRLKHIWSPDTEHKANTLARLLTEQGQPDQGRC